MSDDRRSHANVRSLARGGYDYTYVERRKLVGSLLFAVFAWLLLLGLRGHPSDSPYGAFSRFDAEWLIWPSLLAFAALATGASVRRTRVRQKKSGMTARRWMGGVVPLPRNAHDVVPEGATKPVLLLKRTSVRMAAHLTTRSTYDVLLDGHRTSTSETKDESFEVTVSTANEYFVHDLLRAAASLDSRWTS
jgi:hypothetical protein